ncbi:protein EARLY FLOWERING 4-like [Chenopodium quinoa]|uniref:Protein EARLY FLOWERING 4 domain-containing protein n=1 Tax=Chenopodium quinoa TaxID=63459 RepID=A0A803M3S9_CHEQI|nr:protein EARLY FLOWERING 4-like [Chenopodium quinoa]
MSYSRADSSLDDGDRQQNMGSVGGAGNRRRRTANEFSGDGCRDPETWNAFADSFSQVQSVLDRNRMLIQQANENHQSRMPDNMVKNVAIIQELNGNITKVASIYSELSGNFTGRVKQQRQGGGGKGGSSNGRRDNE